MFCSLTSLLTLTKSTLKGQFHKMTGFVFAIIFGLVFLSILCKGQISHPSDGNTFVALPGQNVTLAWKIHINISDVQVRSWRFLPKGNSFADIVLDQEVIEKVQYSPGPFIIKKPSTLILKNINTQYNGTYRLGILVHGVFYKSYVHLFVAVTPMVMVNCSSPVTLNVGDDYSCECKGQGGNPTAEVTWFKSKKILGTGKEEQILRLTNVDKSYSGIYTCEAKSHKMAKNETLIELVVNYPQDELCFKEKVVVGESFTMSCETNGLPTPFYRKIHNNTKVVSNNKIYAIRAIQYSYAGLYKCIADNKLGSSTELHNMYVIDQSTFLPLVTTTPHFPSTENSRQAHATINGETFVVWHNVVALLCGIIIGVLMSYILFCSRRRWSRIKTPEQHVEQQATNVDKTYQELDLTKMNSEDNYQSLRMNVASDEDTTTYTELNTIRGVEDNYESLT